MLPPAALNVGPLTQDFQRLQLEYAASAASHDSSFDPGELVELVQFQLGDEQNELTESEVEGIASPYTENAEYMQGLATESWTKG